MSRRSGAPIGEELGRSPVRRELQSGVPGRELRRYELNDPD